MVKSEVNKLGRDPTPPRLRRTHWSHAVHFYEKANVQRLPVLCLSGLAVWAKLRNIHFMQAVTDRLKNFLQFVAVKLIDKPEQAQLKVAELGPKKLRFKLVLGREDVAMLIGRNGFTASQRSQRERKGRVLGSAPELSGLFFEI